MTDNPPSSPAIYERLLAECAPYVAETPWDRFRDEAAFCGTTDAAATLASLLNEFPRDALQRSGVITAGANQDVVLNPALTGSEKILIALRGSTGGPPFDILTATGCLSGRTPAVAVIDDRLSEEQDEQLNLLVHVTFSMADAVVLRSIGICAAPAVGLETLGREALHAFRARFGLDDDATPHDADALPGDGEMGPEFAREFATAMDPPQLVVVAWSPATLAFEVPSGLEPLRAHFAALERHLRVSMADVRAWRATAADLEGVRFSLGHGLPQDVRYVVLECRSRSGRGFVEQPGSLTKVFEPPTDHAEAASQLGEVRRRGADKEVRKRAWRNYDESLENDVLGPLSEEALRSPTPVLGNLTLGLVQVSRLFHKQAAHVSEKLSQSIDGAGLGQANGISKEDLQAVETLSNEMLSLTKEIHRCSMRGTIIHVRPNNAQNRAVSPASGSPPAISAH